MDHTRMAYPNHVIFDLYGVDPELIDHKERVLEILRNFAKKIRSSVIGELVYKFEPQGLIIVLLLAQSHISFHSWPEVGYAALDVFSCSEISPEVLIEDVERAFDPEEMKVTILSRKVPELKALVTSRLP